jgi:hypothetical protein
LLRYGAFGLVASALAPGRARPASAPRLQAGEIDHCVIHPAIGVARVGNSPDGWFYGPEVPGPFAVPDGGFKDAAGAVKRQAARFRIYAIGADGGVLGELTAAEAQISWTVHLANKKAAWYQFAMALDLPEASGSLALPNISEPFVQHVPRRNAFVTGDDRGRLAIDPGARSITGAGTNAAGGDPAYTLAGSYVDQPVPLAELRTDEAGRLVVLGGSGSAGPALASRGIASADEDNWYDDTSDGIVDALVTVGGRAIPTTGAWVVVTPPDFAPGVQSIVTAYDVVYATSATLDPLPLPTRPSFTNQIYPLLARFSMQQWVSGRFAAEFGWGEAWDLLSPDLLLRLADPSDQNAPLRNGFFARFRDPAFTTRDPDSLPQLFGDAATSGAPNPHDFAALLPLQYRWLQRWAAGDFDPDWPGAAPRFAGRLEELSLDQQPGALDRAALDACSGIPFHPGIELTWIMRQSQLYEAPFRLRRRTGAEPDWGDVLDPTIALAPNGPLSASGPGDLTRWLAVPWQADMASCFGAIIDDEPFPPSYWPATAPEQVLDAAAYRKLVDPTADAATRLAAFTCRSAWVRGLSPDADAYAARVNLFTHEWSHFGVVTRQPGPSGDPTFPTEVWTEVGRSFPPGSPQSADEPCPQLPPPTPK